MSLPGRQATSEEAARLIERYVRRWLRETPLGRKMLAETGVPFEEAVDAVFELLNHGHLKITQDHEGLSGIRICIPPEPPSGRLERPKRTLN